MSLLRPPSKPTLRLARLIEFAAHEGWEARRAPSGHRCLTKDGLPPIHIGLRPLPLSLLARSIGLPFPCPGQPHNRIKPKSDIKIKYKGRYHE